MGHIYKCYCIHALFIQNREQDHLYTVCEYIYVLYHYIHYVWVYDSVYIYVCTCVWVFIRSLCTYMYIRVCISPSKYKAEYDPKLDIVAPYPSQIPFILSLFKTIYTIFFINFSTTFLPVSVCMFLTCVCW